VADTLFDMGIASGLILLALLGWVGIQWLARGFAARHPEFGPAKEEGAGCGAGCSCSSGHCPAKHEIAFDTNHQELDK